MPVHSFLNGTCSVFFREGSTKVYVFHYCRALNATPGYTLIIHSGFGNGFEPLRRLRSFSLPTKQTRFEGVETSSDTSIMLCSNAETENNCIHAPPPPQLPPKKNPEMRDLTVYTVIFLGQCILAPSSVDSILHTKRTKPHQKIHCFN